MNDGKHLVLIVEDDEAITLGLEENLRFAGYNTITACNGVDGLKLAMEKNPDLILLDVMMPGMSGYDVCRKLRDAGEQMSIIMLTARTDEFDKIHGFEMGADDYVTKPFSVDELLARIRAVLARGKRRSGGPRKYQFGDCVINIDTRTLKKKGKEIPLTRTEFELIAYFCQNEGKALSRDEVMNDVWGTEYYGTQRSLDSFVANIRAKIEKKANKPQHILTVHGVGYKFIK